MGILLNINLNNMTYVLNVTFIAGATREIGTALTRICLRHKAVETKMKTFTR